MNITIYILTVLATMSSTTNFRLATYNSNGLAPDRVETIKTLCETHDIVLIQEHWLLPNNTDIMQKHVDKTHNSYCISAVDNSTLLVGRPYGGCAILSRREMKLDISPQPCNNKRLYPMIISSEYFKILLVCIYMPTDQKYVTDPELLSTLLDLRNLISTHQVDSVMLGGDWNVDLSRPSAHLNEVRDFALSEFLQFGLDYTDSNVQHTFRRKCRNGNISKSLLDHFIMTDDLFSKIVKYESLDFGDNLSDHIPLSIELDLNIDNIASINQHIPRFLWEKASSDDKQAYRTDLDRLLDSIHIPSSILQCTDLHCKCDEHISCIDSLFDCLVNAGVGASEDTIPLSKPLKEERYGIPGWETHVEPYRRHSLFWHAIWDSYGRPDEGALHDIHDEARLRYHQAVKEARNKSKTNSADKLATDLSSNSTGNSFWKTVNKMRQTGKPCTSNMDGACGPDEIATVLRDKYDELYNRVSYGNEEMKQLIDEIDGMICQCSDGKCYSPHLIDVARVENAIKRLKPDKRDGETLYSSDHIIESTPKFRTILSLLINSILRHGHMPSAMRKSVIISIPKDRRKSMADSNNYRGIALSNSIAKLMEIILLEEHESKLRTSDQQFGFKRHLSTTQCTYVLNEVVNYYNKKGSDVYVLLLDASRAFDLVQYPKLFRQLIEREVCPTAMRLLLSSHIQQIICTKWLDQISTPFCATNGVKQGGVISPMLFTVYLDELLHRLEKHDIGCHIGDTYAGAVSYADDVTLQCPTKTGTESMLEVVSEFSEEYHMTFNPGKSKLLVYPSAKNDDQDIPVIESVRFGDLDITASDTAVHLGHIIGPGKNINELSVENAVCTLYGRVNLLNSQFKHCSLDVKYKLFNTFCVNLYGTSLWDFTDPKIEKFFVAWRKCVRKLCQVPPMTHSDYLPFIIDDTPINVRIHKQYLRFIRNNFKSENTLVKLCTLNAYRTPSISSSNMSFLNELYKLKNINSAPFYHIPKLNRIFRDEIVCDSATIRQFLLMRETCPKPDRDNITCIINYLCTAPINVHID